MTGAQRRIKLDSIILIVNNFDGDKLFPSVAQFYGHSLVERSEKRAATHESHLAIKLLKSNQAKVRVFFTSTYLPFRFAADWSLYE